MNVISKKSNRRLIKDQVYETDFFNNDKNATGVNSYTYGRISIKGIGYYQCQDFLQEDGTSLPEKVLDERKPHNYNTISELKKGDIIICKNDLRYKYLIKNAKYRIEDIIHSTSDIKLEGYNRKLKWNNWSFRKLSLQESRELALSQIFDKEENFSVDFKRKFEQTNNKEKVLIETIARSILDGYRHHLGIIDWGIEKVNSNYKIEKSDFEGILGLTLKEIISKVENFEKEY